MTLTINDTAMTSDQTAHAARHAAGREPGWAVSWLPGQLVDRNTAITAMTLADIAGEHDIHQEHRLWPHIQSWAEELGLTGSDAIAQAGQPARDTNRQQEPASRPAARPRLRPRPGPLPALVRHRPGGGAQTAAAGGLPAVGAAAGDGLWQMDVMGRVFLAGGTEVKVVTGIDDHSRFVVCAKVVLRATARPVCQALGGALRRWDTRSDPDR